MPPPSTPSTPSIPPALLTAPAKSASASGVLDAYFLETRAKLLEIAATLDRMDRAPDLLALRGDSRLRFIHDSLQILLSPGPDRARQIQTLYSKP